MGYGDIIKNIIRKHKIFDQLFSKSWWVQGETPHNSRSELTVTLAKNDKLKKVGEEYENKVF